VAQSRYYVLRWSSNRFVRYSLVSVVNVLLGQAILASAYGWWHWDAVRSNLLATAVATGPAYWMSRSWVWKGRGRYHLLWEAGPFWGLMFIGLVLSTAMADGAGQFARSVSSARLVQTWIVMAGTLLAYGLLWIFRFFVMDRWLFPGAISADATAVVETVGMAGSEEARPRG